MRRWAVLLLAVCMVGLCGCVAEQENQAVFPAWEDQLRTLVEAGQDDYLNALTAEEAQEALLLRAVYPGSYTAPDAQELLCRFSVSGVPHVGGLDRTILLLTDQSGSKSMGQITLIGDNIAVILLEDMEGRSYPLFLGVMGNQGIYTYYVEMYEATAAGFVSLPALVNLPQDGNLSYSYMAGGMLQVSVMLPTEFPGTSPEYQSVGIWQWDAEELCFKARS
ncbi:MAG: hypothetical protein K2F83_04930 [Oscillospiraceae bacterium]|nr:hypothetical protein [Oscillospiraceae bacterium]